MVEGGQLIYLLQSGVLEAIRTPTSQFLPTDNTLPLTIEFGMANQYSRDLSQNVKRGIRLKVEKGGFSGLAPMGYRNNRLEKTIEIDPVYFPLVRQFWDWYLSGQYSLKDICDKANTQGFRTPRKKKIGGGKLRPTTLHQIFTNPFYAGIIVYQGEEFPAQHPAMVSREEFDRVQALLKGKTYPKRPQLKFPLRGWMRCGQCGCNITAEHKLKYFCLECRYPRTMKRAHDCPGCGAYISQEVIREAHQYTYYRCTKGRGHCDQGCTRQEILYSQVEDALRRLQMDKELIAWAESWINHVMDHTNQERKQQRVIHQQEAQGLSKRLQSLLDLRLDGELTPEEYRAEKERVESRLEGVREAAENTLSEPQWRERAHGTIRDFTSLHIDYQNTPEADLSYFLGQVFSNPKLQAGKLDLQPVRKYLKLQEIIESSKPGFEPPDVLIQKGKTQDFKVLFDLWYSWLEGFRT